MTETATPGGAATSAPAAPATRAEVCVVACANAFRGNGEVLASAFGTVPAIGVRLARHTFSPDLLLSDGEANLLRGTWPVGGPATGEIEAWAPFRTVFDLVWHGKRHVMMIPSQVDGHGNTNISAIGDYRRPKVQLLGVRGAPGNTVSHPTSYWVPKHSKRVFVSEVDMVGGVGTDRAAQAGPAARRFHDLRRIVTNLAVLDFADDGTVRLASVHPGVSVDEVVEATGFVLSGTDGAVVTTPLPSADELALIRDVLDPGNLRDKEVPG
ncbi:CoA-transferase [Prauserella marina]|uniref:Acyl CoA:acetate/3-ketoacid CoA transferase, beta subunit n=1 Tax=Prauserella marina TaxID=530584 RepID=A0A222VQV2_9PSEU|nr:CoA-transferase [Prauserella marina]ASR36289.1 CoA-transferase [Prauserella marina]PWV77067.1 acyl CoA:acetate/3-ketoacid CoA transferase beta subunit [Prauserella marina]SDD03629.1 Acyl CoA:acetate/3-ketoacid CoA transferase, beta subunit [Prauserella marina]